MSRLKSRHLVLRSLGTLTGQQRFYGTGLIVAREGIDTLTHPTWDKLNCWFCLKLLKICWFMLWWFTCNIPDFDANEYSIKDISNSAVGKYYVTINLTQYFYS
jgi:hypothetical protein